MICATRAPVQGRSGWHGIARGRRTRPSGRGKAKVTFVLQPQGQAHQVHVAGDFNEWQSATPMRRQQDGSWSATLELDPGREYEFRYLVDGKSWVNDDAADAYVPNPFGGDNSMVRVEDAPRMQRSGRRSAVGERTRGRESGSPETGGTDLSSRRGGTGASKRGTDAGREGGSGTRKRGGRDDEGGARSPREPDEGPRGSRR